MTTEEKNKQEEKDKIKYFFLCLLLLFLFLILTYYSLEKYEKAFDKIIANKETLKKWHELEKERICAEQKRFSKVQENNRADSKTVININPQLLIPSATYIPDDMLGVVNAYKHIFYLGVAVSFILFSTIFIPIVSYALKNIYPKKILDEELDNATKNEIIIQLENLPIKNGLLKKCNSLKDLLGEIVSMDKKADKEKGELKEEISKLKEKISDLEKK